MSTPRPWSGALRRLSAALLSMLAMPLAEATEMANPAMTSAVAQLRHAVGLWDVTTTQYDEKGAVAGVAKGTYRFDWVVPDRVLSGRSDIPEWRQSAGMLFYVNPTRSTIEMTSVSPDGQLWVMSGPAGAETRTTARSLEASAPTTVAGYVAPPPKPTRIPDPPATTWSFVRMSPRRSITKPEPSDCTFSVLGGVKKVGATFWVSVAVMTTTPGASRRYSAAGVEAVLIDAGTAP